MAADSQGTRRAFHNVSRGERESAILARYRGSARTEETPLRMHEKGSRWPCNASGCREGIRRRTFQRVCRSLAVPSGPSGRSRR